MQVSGASPRLCMKISTLLFVVLSLVSPVFSQTLSQTRFFEFVPTDSANLTFAQFDTQGGTRTLDGMRVTVSFTRTGGSLEVDNDANTSGLITLTHRITGLVSSVSPLLNSSGGALFGGSDLFAENSTSRMIGATLGGAADPSNQFNRTNGTDYYFWEPPAVTIGQSADVGSAYLGSFVGSGTFGVNFEAIQSISATGTSGLQQAITVANVLGNVTVEYFYSPVLIPEVSTSVLAAVSLAGFLARRRRRVG